MNYEVSNDEAAGLVLILEQFRDDCKNISKTRVPSAVCPRQERTTILADDKR